MTSIQKVEITITSNAEPSRIAREVASQLQKRTEATMFLDKYGTEIRVGDTLAADTYAGINGPSGQWNDGGAIVKSTGTTAKTLELPRETNTHASGYLCKWCGAFSAPERGGLCMGCQDANRKEGVLAGDAIEKWARALAKPTAGQFRERRYAEFRAAVEAAVIEQPTFSVVTDCANGEFVAWMTAPLAGEEQFSVPLAFDEMPLQLKAEMWVSDLAELVMALAGAIAMGKPDVVERYRAEKQAKRGGAVR